MRLLPRLNLLMEINTTNTAFIKQNRLVRKKLRTLTRVDDTTATRRLVGMLARKGYGPGQAYAIVRDELASSGRQAPDSDPD